MAGLRATRRSRSPSLNRWTCSRLSPVPTATSNTVPVACPHAQVRSRRAGVGQRMPSACRRCGTACPSSDASGRCGPWSLSMSRLFTSGSSGFEQCAAQKRDLIVDDPVEPWGVEQVEVPCPCHELAGAEPIRQALLPWRQTQRTVADRVAAQRSEVPRAACRGIVRLQTCSN